MKTNKVHSGYISALSVTKPKKRTHSACSGYLSKAFEDREINLLKAAKTLGEIKFDTVVCTGASGLVFGSPLSLIMRKNLVVIRKPTDNSHSARIIESTIVSTKIKKWIFVDDFIESGGTLKRVLTEMEKWGMYESKSMLTRLAGMYLYESSTKWREAKPPTIPQEIVSESEQIEYFIDNMCK